MVHDVHILGNGMIRGGGVQLMRACIESERKVIADQLSGMTEYIATCENEDTIPGKMPW